MSHPFSKTLPHSLPSSQHRNNSFTTSTSTVATDDGDADADDGDDNDADADVNDAADNDKRIFYKVTTTLVDFLLIKLMSHLSYVKQMYSQPIHLTH